jgi:hypothetical protein
MLDKSQYDLDNSSYITPKLQDSFHSVVSQDLIVIQRLDEYVEEFKRRIEFDNYKEYFRPRDGPDSTEISDLILEICRNRVRHDISGDLKMVSKVFSINLTKNNVSTDGLIKSVAGLLHRIFNFWDKMYQIDFVVRQEMLGIFQQIREFTRPEFEQSTLIRSMRAAMPANLFGSGDQ